MREDITALILAGGKATRLGGIAKHELVVDGETIFQRQVRVLAPRVHEIVVSSPRDIAGYRTVRDIIADIGPFAGVAAGLAACTTPWLLVVAGDMPHITAELVDRMIALRGDDAVALRVGTVIEPLLCVLNVRVRPVVDRRLVEGRHDMKGLLADAGLVVRWIDDADPRALRNVNSPDDL